MKLSTVTKRLAERENINRMFIRRVFEIEDRFIQEVQDQRRTIIGELLTGDLEEEHRNIVERMYFRSDAECMRGRQAHKFNQRLKQRPAAVEEHVSTAILE